MDEYYCPNCGSVLNKQPGFNPSLSIWKCRSCGEVLMSEDVYNGEAFEGVAWCCDECGALLNKQQGFSDLFDEWECEVCGYINEISENAIIDVSGQIN